MVTVRIGNEIHRVEGRVEALIKSLVHHADQLTRSERLRIEYNCSGPVIRPLFEIHPEDIRVTK